MWKPLSIVSGIALLAGGGIFYGMVRPAYIAEKAQAANASDFKAKAEKNKLDQEAAFKKADTDLQKMKDSLSAAERAKAEANTRKQAAEKDLEAAKASKEAASKELADQKQKMEDIGGIETAVAELKSLEAKRVEYDKQIASAKATVESSLARKASVDKQIAEVKRIDAWQQGGIMAPTFRSRVTAVNPDWGFVTIGAGNSASVTRQAKLDVVRGGSVVGKLVVTHVSPGSAAAEIVPGSVAPGDSILPGDQVKTGAGSLPGNLRPAPARPAATPATPAAGTPAAPAEAAPADPFAPAPAAPEAPAAAPDAPAADAPIEPAATPMAE